MKKTLVALLLALPLAGLAAPGAPPADPAARRAHWAKRMRLARTLGLADACDLSEAEALKAREVMGRYDERRQALRKQALEAAETVRRSAQGDAAAQKGLDAALAKLRELRGQRQAQAEEMFQALTREWTAERKAKAALFFQHFRSQVKARMGERLQGLRERHELLRGKLRGPPGGPAAPEGGPPPPRGSRWGAYEGAGYDEAADGLADLDEELT